MVFVLYKNNKFTNWVGRTVGRLVGRKIMRLWVTQEVDSFLGTDAIPHAMRTQSFDPSTPSPLV